MELERLEALKKSPRLEELTEVESPTNWEATGGPVKLDELAELATPGRLAELVRPREREELKELKELEELEEAVA